MVLTDPIAFEDVAIHFSLEEWALLNPDQKVLHVQIMEEIHGIVNSLGKAPSLMGISISKCSIPVSTSLVGAFSRKAPYHDNSSGLLTSSLVYILHYMHFLWPNLFL
uniref:KRAB domain-containing protein n=1 Tax=Anolis carolinensis TaxID=28377 RepID=A0A803SWU7_ANOCA